ncbi:MAG: UDP-N-acetyl-D-mannosamine dehydrogenase, partial [Pseudomonadales bacterium 32-61-5]
FKPDIDDMRESPAMMIVEHLAGALPGQILAVEPNIDALPERLAKAGVTLASAEEAIAGADVWALLVDHRGFRDKVPARREGVVIVDTRGIWTAAA